MSEAETQDERATIESTKTVVVAEDVHNAISHIATDREDPIKAVVDDVLRGDDTIQKELEIRNAKDDED
jgi:hypothetical protein